MVCLFGRAMTEHGVKKYQSWEGLVKLLLLAVHIILEIGHM